LTKKKHEATQQNEGSYEESDIKFTPPWRLHEDYPEDSSGRLGGSTKRSGIRNSQIGISPNKQKLISRNTTKEKEKLKEEEEESKDMNCLIEDAAKKKETLPGYIVNNTPPWIDESLSVAPLNPRKHIDRNGIKYKNNQPTTTTSSPYPFAFDF